jgi:hypothetical protein
MKKNNRDQYLKTWLAYLKGKNQIDPKALAEFLGKNLKGAFSSITMKRYTATIIANLYENGFLAGKIGKTFSGEPLEIVQEITLPILDRCLPSNYKKIKFTDLDHPAEPTEPLTKAPAVKKPRKAAEKKKVEKPKKLDKKQALKPAKAKAEKMVKVKAGKPVARKPGPQKKKIAEKPKQAIVAKAKKAPGRKTAVKKPGLVGRKTDLLKMGEGAFLYSLELTRRVEELERENVGYQKVFEAIRGLFSREMDEIEEWLGVVLK